MRHGLVGVRDRLVHVRWTHWKNNMDGWSQVGEGKVRIEPEAGRGKPDKGEIMG